MNYQVDAYIDALQEEQQEIANAIRNILLEEVNGIEELYSFKIPFYHYFGMFCYINKLKNGIELCFCSGKHLVLAFPQLEMKNRKLIAGVTLNQKSEIQKLEIVQLVKEAAALQAEIYHQKKNTKTG